jgi:AraC family transcriptional regulator of adaptative response / DNA-3-methyladenine glycosylase II
MAFADVAFAAGFSSIRQFNDTVREVYATSPTELRTRSSAVRGVGEQLGLRLAVRRPFAGAELLSFLAARAVDGVEKVGPGWYARSLRLPHGPGWAGLSVDGAGSSGFVRCTLNLTDLRDLTAAVERCRRLLDADCDPVAVDDALGRDPVIARLVRSRPGLRVPGHVDGHELAVRAVLGQQVSLAHARMLTALLVERYGDACVGAGPGPARLFPTAQALAEVPPESLPMPRSRGRALTTLCAALAAGDIPLDRSADRGEVRRALVALPGIGPWTADYIALRALGDPDVFMTTDAGLRRAAGRAGLRLEDLGPRSHEWRPWRSYAQMHLWSSPTSGGSALHPRQGRHDHDRRRAERCGP